MKHTKITLAVIVSLWLPMAVSTLLVPSTGCAFKGAAIADGADPIVVHAERTQNYALDTFDTFLRWEKENRALLNKPEVKAAADNIRLNYRQWDDDLSAAIKSYKSTRSKENADKLDIALAVVGTALDVARRYLVTKTVNP